MIKLIIQKFNHSSKYYINFFIYQNVNFISKSISKHIKKREFVHSNNVQEIDFNIDKAEIEMIHEIIKDISDIQFIIIYYYIFKPFDHGLSAKFWDKERCSLGIRSHAWRPRRLPGNLAGRPCGKPEESLPFMADDWSYVMMYI